MKKDSANKRSEELQEEIELLKKEGGCFHCHFQYNEWRLCDSCLRRLKELEIKLKITKEFEAKIEKIKNIFNGWINEEYYIQIIDKICSNNSQEDVNSGNKVLKRNQHLDTLRRKENLK